MGNDQSSISNIAYESRDYGKLSRSEKKWYDSHSDESFHRDTLLTLNATASRIYIRLNASERDAYNKLNQGGNDRLYFLTMSAQLRARYLWLEKEDEKKFLLKNYYLDVYTFNRMLVDFRTDKRREAAFDKTNAALDKTMENIDKTRENIDKTFEALRKRINGTENDVRELRDDVDTLQTDMTNTKSRLDEHDGEINNLQEQQEQLRFFMMRGGLIPERVTEPPLEANVEEIEVL